MMPIGPKFDRYTIISSSIFLKHTQVAINRADENGRGRKEARNKRWMLSRVAPKKRPRYRRYTCLHLLEKIHLTEKPYGPKITERSKLKCLSGGLGR